MPNNNPSIRYTEKSKRWIQLNLVKKKLNRKRIGTNQNGEKILAKLVDLIGLNHGGLTKRNISNAFSVVADLKYILRLQVIRIYF